MTYSISGGTFTDKGKTYLQSIGNSIGDAHYGGFFSQLSEDTLLTISRSSEYIQWYRLDHIYHGDGDITDMYGVYKPAIPKWASAPCLASSTAPSSRIYVTGGANSSSRVNTAQVLELGEETNEWLDNVPSMTFARFWHACVVIDDILYVVGGNDGALISEMERINITNIQSAAWQTWGESLSADQFGQVVVVDGVIYTIGGRNNLVYAIDTESGQVTHHSSLAISRAHITAVAVDHTIYGFGGWVGWPGRLNSWTTYTLLSGRVVSFSLVLDTRIL